MKYNKNGKPNLNSVKQAERIMEAENIIHHYFNNNRYKFVQKSMVAGQISRMNGCIVQSYNGKYGKGVTIDVPYFGKGSKYHEKYYFIEKEGDEID